MKYLISFIVLLLSTNILFAQSRHFEYYDEYLELGYDGQINQGQLSASLTITDLSTGVVYSFGTLSIDISSENYKLGVASQLITKASQIDAGQTTVISDVLLRKIINAMSNTAGRYGGRLSALELKTEEAEGFFYYNSVFNIINRHRISLATGGTSSYECSPYNGYIVGLTPFYAKEDIIITVQDLKNYLHGNNLRVTEQTASFMVESLNNTTSAKVSFKYLESFFDSLFQSNPNRLYMSGSSCGCCGNYSGVCYFASVNCLVHDYLCQSCSPSWFCLGGCVPSACN